VRNISMVCDMCQTEFEPTEGREVRLYILSKEGLTTTPDASMNGNLHLCGDCGSKLRLLKDSSNVC